MFTWRRDLPADTAAPALLFLKSPATGADWLHGLGGGARAHCLVPTAGCPGGRTGQPPPAALGLGLPERWARALDGVRFGLPRESGVGAWAAGAEPAPLRVPRLQEPLLTPGHPAPPGLRPPTAPICAAPDPLDTLLGVSVFARRAAPQPARPHPPACAPRSASLRGGAPRVSSGGLNRKATLQISRLGDDFLPRPQPPRTARHRAPGMGAAGLPAARAGGRGGGGLAERLAQHVAHV